jgi:hypothetical protein
MSDVSSSAFTHGSTHIAAVQYDRWPAWRIASLRKSGALTVDDKILQRILNTDAWSTNRTFSLLTALLNGEYALQQIVVVDVRATLKWITSALALGGLSAADTAELKNGLEYFTRWSNDEAQYLILDGNHRTYFLTEYLSGNIDLEAAAQSGEPAEILWRRLETGDEVSLEGKFTDLDHELQASIRNTVYYDVKIISARSLRDLRNIFINLNSGTPVCDSEMRILHFSSHAEWVRNKTYKNATLHEVLKSVQCKAEYNPQTKGDATFLTQIAMFMAVPTYSGTPKELERVYHVSSVPGVETTTPTARSKTNAALNTALKGIQILRASKCINFKTLSVRSLINFIWATWMLQDDQCPWRDSNEYTKPFVITDAAAWAQFFFDQELKRLNHPDASTRYYDAANKQVARVINPMSYLSHQRDLFHARKRAVKGIGGSPYDFADYADIRWIAADLFNKASMSELLNDKIIEEKGTRSAMPSLPAIAAANDWKDADGNPIRPTILLTPKYHAGHLMSVRDGGSSHIDNLVVQDKTSNLKQGALSRVKRSRVKR